MSYLGTFVNFPKATQWIECPKCHEFWSIRFNLLEFSYNAKQIDYEVSLMKLEYSNHMASHVNKEVTNEQPTPSKSKETGNIL